MAASSKRAVVGSGIMRIWTFTIRGGLKIRLSVKDHPLLDHPGEGHTTIWKVAGTTEEIDGIQAALEELGCAVMRYSEGETKEQRSIRMARLGKGDGDAVL